MNKKFPLPVFMAGAIVGILFTYGLSIISGVDIEKAEPFLNSYGTGFALGTTATAICFLIAAAVNSPCFGFRKEKQNKTIQEG